MINADYEPTKAEVLASLVIGNANMTETTATVQRSHRFPLHLFVQIENMARVAKVPVSVIINQLLECGLDAVRKELPEDVLRQLNEYSKEQFGRPTKLVSVEIKGRNAPTQKKAKSGK